MASFEYIFIYRQSFSLESLILWALIPFFIKMLSILIPRIKKEIHVDWYGANTFAWLHSKILSDAQGNLLPQYEYETPDHIHPNVDGVKVIAWSWLTAIFK